MLEALKRHFSAFPNFLIFPIKRHTLKNVNDYLNANIHSYLETSGGQSSNLYLNIVHFLTPELIRHLW